MPEIKIVDKNHAQHLKKHFQYKYYMCVPLWDVSFNYFLLTSLLRALASPRRGPGGWPLWHLKSCFPYLRTPLVQFHGSSQLSKDMKSTLNIFFPPVRDLIPFLRVFLLGAFLPHDCCFSVLDGSWGRSSLRASVYFFSLHSSGNTWRFSLHGPRGPCLRREGMQSEAVTRIYTKKRSISFSANRSGYPSK